MAPKRKGDASAASASPKKKRSEGTTAPDKAAAADSPAKSSSKAARSSPSKNPRAAASTSKDLDANADATKSTTAETSGSTSKGKSGKKAAAVEDVPPVSERSVKEKKSSKTSKEKKSEDTKERKSTQASSSKSKRPHSASNEGEGLDSTSTPAPEAPKRPKKVPFEDAFSRFFAQYVSAAEPDHMDGEGIEQLFKDMDLSMDGVYPMLLAHLVNAKPGSFGTFSRSDFEDTFKSLDITSASHLRAVLQEEYDEVFDPGWGDEVRFGAFYLFLFPFVKSESAKTVPPEVAIPLLSISLAERHELGKSFVEFATAQGSAFKAVSFDVWSQLLDFVNTVDEDLNGWSEDNAWPSTIDAFVEWQKARQT
ncbi:hypothetical protein JCM8202_006098 [Rhodotorula sphaerocarpa]